MKEDYCEIYLSWLRQNIEQVQINENICRITLPFLDKDNDEMDIYIIKKTESEYLLTDDGAVINNLLLSGIDLKKKNDRRKSILDSMVNSYGITLTKNYELTTTCSIDNFALKKHMLTQCMLKVGDMFLTSRANIQSLFFEDVKSFLDKNHIRYIDSVSFTGKSKLPTKYDFAIPKSDTTPERIIQVFNNFTLSDARSVIFSWTDTRDYRPKDASLYTFISDNEEKRISEDSIQALKEYSITPVLWSQREAYIPLLTA